MNLLSIIKVLESMIPGFNFLYCYITANFDLTTMKLLFTRIKFDYESVTDEKELNIMKKYANKSKLYVYLLMVLLYSYFILITAPSILYVFLYIFGTRNDTHLILPFPVNTVSLADWLYYNLLIYQIMGAFILITMSIIIYSLFWALIHHACGQFTVIIRKIWRPFKHNQRHTQKSWFIRTPQEEWDWMIDIIKCYTRVTEFVNLINSLYKIIYLIAIFTSGLIVIFHFLYMFQLFTALLSTTEIIEGFIYVAVFLSALYITFYMGQMLINHSSGVFVELCNIPFYILSIKTQKLLLLILIRCMKPPEISVNGIFVMSHKIFGTIIQKGFSFATVYYSLLYK